MANFTSSDYEHDDDYSARNSYSFQQFHSEESYDDSHGDLTQKQGDGTESTGQGQNDSLSMRACDQCRKRRSKCNRRKPCSVCVDRGDSERCTYTSVAMKRGPRGGWAQYRAGHEVVIRDEPVIGDLLVVRMTSQIHKNLEEDPAQEGKSCFQYGLDSSPAARKYVNEGLEGTLFGMYGAQDLDPEHPITAAMLNTPWIRDLNRDFQEVLDKANLARQMYIKTNGSPYASPNPLVLHEYGLRKDQEEATKSTAKSEADEPQTGSARRSNRSTKNARVKASPKSTLTKSTRRSTRQPSGDGRTTKQQADDFLHHLTYPSGIQRRTQNNGPTFMYPMASGSVSSAVLPSSSPSSSEHENDSLVNSMADASLVTPTQALFTAGSQAMPSQSFGTQFIYQPSIADFMPSGNQDFDPSMQQIHHQIPNHQMRNPLSSQQLGHSVMPEIWTPPTNIPADSITTMAPSTQTASAHSTVVAGSSTHILNLLAWAGRVPVTQAAGDQFSEYQGNQGLHEADYTNGPINDQHGDINHEFEEA